jgi:hypothetical protein
METIRIELSGLTEFNEKTSSEKNENTQQKKSDFTDKLA